MKGESNLPTKIKENKITTSKWKRKEDEEPNEIDKDDKSDPKLLEYYKVLVDDSFRSLCLDNFVVFKSVDNIYYLIYFNKENSIISYNLVLNKKVNEIKNAHLEDFQKLKHYYDSYNQRNLVVSEDSKSNVKIWSIENLECICSLNLGEKKEKSSNIS